MIDPTTDPAGAVEEIEFLAKHLPTADLRAAIDKLLAVGLSRLTAAPTSYVPVAGREAYRLRVADDYLANIMASFRDRIAARAAP